ncbi:Protein CBG27601 [Caenorhabditis briggsae]|uniref:Protein CBG27601 n=2 Tax=Caenorhabditis briggsae TaxID=6238 RepID=B6IKH1_CAEBR|nr:Protein CBG27601 [Caenorhabditis briggsae]ULT81419.1 hypothetical protein L3Y34_011367 [Caenorhabditis briggsae]CAS00401.1 Protein CBG27601 [Caenorhabditis briggsae]
MPDSANSSSHPEKRRQRNFREPKYLSLLRQLDDDEALVLSNFENWANRVDDLKEKESLLKMIPDLKHAHELIEKILVSVEKRESSVPKQFSEFWDFFHGRFNEKQLAKHVLIAGIFESIQKKMGEAEKEFKSWKNVEEPPAKKKSNANGNQINDASKAASIPSIPVGNKIGQENQIRLSFAGTTDNSKDHHALNRNAKGAYDTDERDFVSVEDLPKILKKIEKDLEGYGLIIKGFQFISSAESAEMVGRAEYTRKTLLDFIRNLTNNYIEIMASDAMQKLRKTIEKQTQPVQKHCVNLTNAIETMFEDVKTNWIQLAAILRGDSNTREVWNDFLEIPNILDTIENLLEACEYSIKAFQVLNSPGSADTAKMIEEARTTLLNFIKNIRNTSFESAATGAAQKMEEIIKEQTPLADKNWVHSAKGIQTMFEDVKSHWNQVHAFLKKRPSNSSTASSIPATKQPAPGLNEIG